MRFGNRRPRPRTAVESKRVSTHGRGPFRPVRQLSEYKGKGASASRENFFNCNFRIRLAAITQIKNDRDELGRHDRERKWRRSLNATKQTWLLSYAFGEVWGFARFISSILNCSLRGWRSVVEDYGKESIDESEISIHSSPTSGYVYFKRKSFVCVADRKDFNPVGHCLLCAF